MHEELYVFDVDGTLIEKNIGTTFVKYMMARKLLSPFTSLFLVVMYGLYRVKLIDFEYAIKMGYWAVSGCGEEEVSAWASDCFSSLIKNEIFSDARAAIIAAKDRGAYVVLATGAHEPIAKLFAADIGAHDCVCTKSLIKDGRYTYRGIFPLPYRDGKRALVKERINNLINEKLLTGTGLKITVFTDEEKDLPLLELADHCVAVNADKIITDAVLSRNGKVCTFT